MEDKRRWQYDAIRCNKMQYVQYDAIQHTMVIQEEKAPEVTMPIRQSRLTTVKNTTTAVIDNAF